MGVTAASSTDQSEEQRAERAGRDWRIWFGLTSTLVWLWLGAVYIGGVVGWQSFVTQPAEALGGFLEGAFAPLAFLWLVIGYFLQQRELSSNTRAIRLQYEQMRRTAENAEVQARALADNERHQRQETLLLIADRVQRQIGAVVGLLWMSSQGPGNENPTASDELVADLWERLGAGDAESFARQFISIYFRADDPGDQYDLFFGTEIRRRHSNTSATSFGRLVDHARACDSDGMMVDALMGSAHGRIYQIIQSLDDSASTPTPTPQHST